ncbi:MAG: aldo/keto reductase [Acidimicrobiales bacterium]
MKYRKFGNTGLEISELIFGAGAVGGLLINADDDTKRQAIRMALDAGVNWIDTAASYGQGRSEQALAWLMKEIPADSRPYISSKMAFDSEAGDFVGQAERCITESLERLQMERIELFQSHNRVAPAAAQLERSLTVEQFLGKGGVADALDRLVEQGLIGHTGITATGDTASLHEVISSERFASAQIYYNLLNPSAGRAAPPDFTPYNFEQLIDTAQHHGVAVMVIRVLAAGVIATDVRTGKEGGVVIDNDVAADEARMRKVLALLKPEHGERSQVAFRYALRHPGVSGIEVGTAELEHVRLAIEAAEMGPLPDDLLAELDALVDADFR